MKKMLATIRDIVGGFVYLVEDLDRVEISIFIVCAGLMISAVFGFATLLFYVICECPIVAIVLLISFGIPTFAILYAKHSKKSGINTISPKKRDCCETNK